MNDRIGLCESCGAKYGNIPDSLTATKVKCKKCAGVVNIPPLNEEVEASTPPSKLESKPVVEKAAIERPAAAKPVDRKVARPVKPVVPAKPKPVVPAKPRVVAPPVVKEATPPKPSGADLLANLRAKKAAESSTTEAAKPTPPKKSGADLLAEIKSKKKAEPAVHNAGAIGAMPPRKTATKARPGSKIKRKIAAKPNAGGKREHPHPKKGFPVLMTVIAVVVLGGAGAGLMMITNAQKAKEQKAADDFAAATERASLVQENREAEMAANNTELSGAVSETPIGNAPEANDGATEVVEAPTPKIVEVAESAPFDLPIEGETIVYTGVTDPKLITLDLVPRLPKWSGCDDAQWADIKEDLELYLEDSGAMSNRAGNRLTEAGRPAYPALVNAMLATDWNDGDSFRICSALNNLITGMSAGGKNFGWESIDQHEVGSDQWTKAILWDKKVVAIWYNQWISKFSNDDKQWAGFAEKKTKPKEEEASSEDVAPSFDEEFDD